MPAAISRVTGRKTHMLSPTTSAVLNLSFLTSLAASSDRITWRNIASSGRRRKFLMLESLQLQPPDVFQTVFQFVVPFAADARREILFGLADIFFHRFRIALGEFAQDPRHCLDDHVLAVVDEQIANGKRARGITAASINVAAGFVVKRDGRNERRSADPEIR